MVFKKRKHKRLISMFMTVFLLLSTFLPNSIMGKAHAAIADHVVISQVYGGGGNTGASYKNDFVELYNPTDHDVSLDGWSVQYTSKSGTSAWNVAPLGGTIKSHCFYLVEGAEGKNAGMNLPSPDANGAQVLSMGATDGMVALVDTAVAIITGEAPKNAIDFVGYGAASKYEGSGPTNSSNTLSAQRRPYANINPGPGLGNAWDSDDNAVDFVAATPVPRNAQSPAEAPYTPSISLQPQGTAIQYTKQDASITVTGIAGAAPANSVINVYDSATRKSSIGTATAQNDGSFTVQITSDQSLPSIFVTSTQDGMAESPPIEIELAKLSNVVVPDKISYFIQDGIGTLIGNANAGEANSIIRVYPDEKASVSEKLADTTTGTTGDFSTKINNAPETVYVTQQSSTSKGTMLESIPVSIKKTENNSTKIKDVRAFDENGMLNNAGKSFTIEGIATVDNQILGNQKQNFYLQDDTAGINIYSTTLTTGFAVAAGDKLLISGSVIDYNGLAEFSPTIIEKISEGNPIPEAKNVSINDLNTFQTAEPLEGTLIAVTGKVSDVPASGTSGANYNVTLVDENNKAITVRIISTTDIKSKTDLIVGKSYTITGLVGQYTSNKTAKTTGYQVFPRSSKDIAPILDITHTPITQAYKETNIQFDATAQGAETVTVYYREIGTTSYQSIQMTPESDGNYSALLQASSVPDSGFEYYIEAKAGSQIKTAGTRENPYKVTLVKDTIGPEFTGETPQNLDKVESLHPEISVLMNDPSGVNPDSVKMWLDGKEVKAPEASISKTQVKYTPEQDLSMGVHKVKVSATDERGNLSEKEWTFEVVPLFTEGHHYRGTTHNHTQISHDASGTPEDALKAGKAHHYDWFAFSDHSHDIDPTLLGKDTVDHNGMPERTGGEQWQLEKDLAKEYTKNGEFVVFPAFEMTSTTWGHSNIFGSDHFIDRNINGKQYQNLDQYYAWVMTYDDIVGQFNHPDMSANAFNNFKPYNKEVDKLFTMLEVGNGSGHYGYVNAEEKFYSALDLGWHVAPTFGEDNHEGTWGQTNNRTVIVAKDLSQASLMDSMRKMRVYMEEDPNFTLDVLANGYYMGSTVDSKTLNFHISGNDDVAEAHNDSDYSYLPTTYKSDDRIAKVELITNGGKVVDSTIPMTKDFTWNPSYEVTGGQQWFVVKVTQMDGERIYSSPIWSKEEPVDVKVNSVDIDGGVIIEGNPATLKATIANNGTETVNNLKVDFYYDEASEKNFIGTSTIPSILSKNSAIATTTWNSPLSGDHKIIAIVTAPDGPDIGNVMFTLPVKIKAPLGMKVLIDASHGNENSSGDSGSYKDNLKSFTLLLQKEGYTVTENKEAFTDDGLKDVRVIVLTHPKTALSDTERAAVAKFVKNGGAILIAGKSNNSTDPTINNPLLADIGTQIRMNNDGVLDDSKTGNFWSDPKTSPWAVRIHPGLVPNHITDRVSFVDYYSGASLTGPGDQPLAITGKMAILAKGNETTYQGNIKGGYTYDAKSDDTGGSAIPLIASDEIGNGRVVVSGMNFFNDKQMDESFEPKGNNELSLNAVNWLAHRDTKVSSIADARKLADDTEAVIQGTVTTGAGVFFDAFYVQDETGGIMAFKEVPDGTNLKPGDKVRIYGHLKTYENNKEFEFNSYASDVIKIGSGDPIQPKLVSTGSATSDQNQGMLVKVKGIVVSQYDENSYFINDGTGATLVFTDGYIVNQNGPVPVLKVGDTLEAVGLSGKFTDGNRIRVRDTKELIGTKIPPATPIPPAPIVNPVSNKDLVITGKAIEYGTVIITDGQTVRLTVSANASGDFTAKLLAPLKEGTKLDVSVTNAYNNISPITSIVVKDVISPNAPFVNKVNNTDKTITGSAEIGSIVTVLTQKTIIGKAITDKFGKFTVTLHAALNAGTILSLTATDPVGNKSLPTFITVGDKIAPARPKVNIVKDVDKKVAGKTEAFAKIVVKAGTSIIGYAIADKNGNYSVSLKSSLKAGTSITVVSIDKAGNVSLPTVIKVIDKTPPTAPKVDKVSRYTTKITGKAEPKSTIILKIGNKVIKKTVADKNGKFSLTISKQKPGTILIFTAKDSAGNESRMTKVMVKK